MKRLALPTTRRRAPQPDTWTNRLLALAAAANRAAHTPHTIQLMPVRMTVVRPRRSIRGTIRTGLLRASLIGGASAGAYYLGGHREQAAAVRTRLIGTGRDLVYRYTRAQHNGAGLAASGSASRPRASADV